MSGIVAILHRNGSPVPSGLVGRLTSLLAFRGPDEQRTWCEGPVGLGHALLRTTPESEHERQPFSLDKQAWIIADARVDARDELCEALAHASGDPPAKLKHLPDAELILRAYQAWGEACVEHLLGDFCFVVWDGNRRRLFAARDPLGVKPLFYAETGDVLLVGNVLNCLRQHPSISGTLSDRFIGDFLLGAVLEDPTATVWREIARLPAAHTLVWDRGTGVRLRRYWTMPIEEPLRYRRKSEYLEEFRILLQRSVRDRLRTDRVSISMSGGLDSPAVAATACALYGREAVADAVRGVTMVFDRLIPDRERQYSEMVAHHLGFPIHYVVGENYRLFQGEDDGSLASPEPIGYPLEFAVRERFPLSAAHGRVLLTGEGGDPGLVPSLRYYRGRRIPALVGGILRYLVAHRRLPRIGFRLAWNRWQGKVREQTSYPRWLQPGFEARAGLRERWHEINREPPEAHPDRPAAYAAITGPNWDWILGFYEPTRAEEAIETRHPLFDLRLVQFFLRLPTLPWCADKELLRIGLRGALPEQILRRPKEPLAGDPVKEMLRRAEPKWADEYEGEPWLSEYVVRDRVPGVAGPSASGDWEVDLMPRSLNCWLRNNAHERVCGDLGSLTPAERR